MFQRITFSWIKSGGSPEGSRIQGPHLSHMFVLNLPMVKEGQIAMKQLNDYTQMLLSSQGSTNWEEAMNICESKVASL